jgi:hypothetical protein
MHRPADRHGIAAGALLVLSGVVAANRRLDALETLGR